MRKYRDNGYVNRIIKYFGIRLSENNDTNWVGEYIRNKLCTNQQREWKLVRL